MRLAASGYSDKAIANELGISLATVKSYWTRLRQRFGASNRTEVVAMAMEGSYSADGGMVCLLLDTAGNVVMTNVPGAKPAANNGSNMSLYTAVLEVMRSREAQEASVAILVGEETLTVNGTLLPIYQQDELSSVALVGTIAD